MPDARLAARLKGLTWGVPLLGSLFLTPKLGAQAFSSEPGPNQLIVSEWSFDQHRLGSPEPALAIHPFPAFELRAQPDSTGWPIGEALTGALFGVGVIFLVQATRCRDDCFVFWPPLSWVAVGGAGGFVVGALMGARK